MKKSKKKEKSKVGEQILGELQNYGMGIYLFAVLMLMPVYIFDHYWEMALSKWKIYLAATMGLLVATVCILIAKSLIRILKRKEKPIKWSWLNINGLDIAVFVYLLMVLLSFGTCTDKRAAWMGASGWYMGILSQLLFVGTYYFFAKVKVPSGVLLILHGATTAFCGFYAICQRYGWDWMYLYWDMPAEVVRDYISTIGNRTWFSAYLCVAFPIGMYIFWRATKKWVYHLSGVYLFVMFQGMLVTSSDSIYMALMAVLWVMGLLSIGDTQKIKRFLEILILCFMNSTLMSVVHLISPEFPKGLRGISGILADWRISLPLLILSLLLWIVMSLKDGSISCKWYHGKSGGLEDWTKEKKNKWQKWIVFGTCGLGALLLLFIYFNTAGVFQKMFGITIHNKYLLFDDSWGDSRGHTWRLTLQMFGELSWKQKLFGVGADCYAMYAYSNPQFSQVLQSLWGESIMTNAHNEWLNSMFCLGLLGGLSYLACFLMTIYQCLVKTDLQKVHPLVPSVGLCTVAYVCHNFFCYQQICVTPFIFILMGVAVNKKCMDEKMHI